MSPLLSRSAKGPAPLAERIDALESALEALDGVAADGPLESVTELLDRVDRRRALSAEHTVIGLFGATGSGKSSLVNALVGVDVSRAAVRRPTTAKPVAGGGGAPPPAAAGGWGGGGGPPPHPRAAPPRRQPPPRAAGAPEAG